MGYNYGRENTSRVEKICRKSLIYSTVMVTLGFLVIVLANDSIMNIFVKVDEQLKDVAIDSSKIYYPSVFK